MINYEMLTFLGFTSDEIHFVECALNYNCGKLVTPATILRKFAMDNNINTHLDFNKLSYLTNILIGNSSRRIINSLNLIMNCKNTVYGDTYRSSEEFRALDILARHFSYMRNNFRISNSIEIRTNRDLPESKLTEVVELAEIEGIEDDSFSIYNSDRYEDNSKYLKVKKRGNIMQLIPKRLPVIKYKAEPKIDGVIELRKDEYSDFGETSYTLYVNSRYVKLLNTFIICVSIRMPDNHLGMFDIVTDNGSRIYVYATEWTAKNRKLKSSSTEYNSNQARIVDYGYTNKQLEDKLYKLAVDVSNRYSKKLSLYVAPVREFDETQRIELNTNLTRGKLELDLGLGEEDYEIGD